MEKSIKELGDGFKNSEKHLNLKVFEIIKSMESQKEKSEESFVKVNT